MAATRRWRRPRGCAVVRPRRRRGSIRRRRRRRLSTIYGTRPKTSPDFMLDARPALLLDQGRPVHVNDAADAPASIDASVVARQDTPKTLQNGWAVMEPSVSSPRTT